MMATQPPLNWSEGMFLTPQHMQALMRHLEGRLAETRLAASPHAWGISRLEIDPAALANYRFTLRAIEADLDDGTRVRCPEECEIPSRDLKPAFEDGAKALEILLGIPELRPRSPNIVEEGSQDATVRRYRVNVNDEVDENTGGGARPIEYRRLQARILVAGEEATGYCTLPIARVQLAGEADPLPALVPDYIPPVCRVAADPRLFEMMKELTNALGAKSRSLGEQTAERRIAFGGEGGGGDAEMLWRLYVVNAALSVFRILVRTPSLHPFDAYVAVARLVGELAIFDRGRVPPVLDDYDPRALGTCFPRAVQEARRLLDAILPQAFVRRSFEPWQDALRCHLDEDWLARRAPLYIGVESEQPQEEVEKRLRVLKLGAPRDAARIKSDRLSGIEKAFVPRVPPELPDRNGLRFWRIQPQGDFWVSAQDERALALLGARADDPAYKFFVYAVIG